MWFSNKVSTQVLVQAADKTEQDYTCKRTLGQKMILFETGFFSMAPKTKFSQACEHFTSMLQHPQHLCHAKASKVDKNVVSATYFLLL